MNAKTCKACGNTKPRDQFSPRESRCKTCVNTAAKAYRQTPEYRAAQEKYRSSVKGRAATKARESRESVRAVRLAYAASAAGKAAQERFRKTEAGKASAASRIKRYRATEKGRLKAMEIDKKRAAKPHRVASQRKAWKKYCATPKGKVRNHNSESMRRLRIGRAESEKLTVAQWLRIQRDQNNKCYYCKRPSKLTMDHVIPLAKGGLHRKENIVGACLKCNLKKGTKIVTLF